MHASMYNYITAVLHALYIVYAYINFDYIRLTALEVLCWYAF